ncbi:PAS domain S-box protein [Sphingopyxis sp. PAMC25046]|uniref:sensor histidine kinase n=1 Tax=Sphingopyxis sp. PAMC25046 TaxID=2565556 RepID=UPI00109DEA5D|nr:HWE histidine kinase domain-containing protein [Sphingopyxis sp. PAMC25046]QCB54489.1 PAS domain S-box protein [Sphingopyxis sp. PAMC25046]
MMRDAIMTKDVPDQGMRCKAEVGAKALVDGLAQAVWETDARGIMISDCPAWRRHTGQSLAELLEHGWIAALHPDERRGARRRWCAAVARGRSLDIEARLQTEGGGYRWSRLYIVPLRTGDDSIGKWIGMSIDIMARKEAEQALRQSEASLRVLVTDLQHRVRNMAMVVRSVFSRTIRGERPIEDIAEHFRGRLDSLARTQVMLAQHQDGPVDLENLIRDELLGAGVQEGPRLSIEGPDVGLNPVQTELLALAFHELTTNALKYGALRVPGGRLKIVWRLNAGHDGHRQLDLEWAEYGVPAIPVRPAYRGFGMEWIMDALPYRLGAETHVEFLGGGVRCSFSLPLPERDDTASAM